MTSNGNGLVDASITIRRAESPADYRACQVAQRQAWGITEEGYVIPVATMVGANLHGGLVLGAFLADGRAVAMSFAFLGRVHDRVCLYSQLTGVVPEYQSRGLGHAMKLVQRANALLEGVNLIAWAFDPLQSGNAFFNMHRLRATARRYVDNMYGPRTDALNTGAPTDRLIAEWALDPDPEPESTERREPDVAEIRSCPRLIAFREDKASPRWPYHVNAPMGVPCVLLEIPARIAALRKDQPELAEAWREAVHDAFLAAFSDGYEATDFVRDDASPERRLYYVLRRSRQ